MCRQLLHSVGLPLTPSWAEGKKRVLGLLLEFICDQDIRVGIRGKSLRRDGECHGGHKRALVCSVPTPGSRPLGR